MSDRRDAMHARAVTLREPAAPQRVREDERGGSAWTITSPPPTCARAAGYCRTGDGISRLSRLISDAVLDSALADVHDEEPFAP